MDILIGILIWIAIGAVWYVRTYPERFGNLKLVPRFNFKWPQRKKRTRFQDVGKKATKHDYMKLVKTVEAISAMEKYGSSDAADMVEAVKKLMEIEPASGQVWEAFALDSLETADITCDDCKIPVDKIVRKTGVKILCTKCMKWLALKNSKVTVIDPNRPDLEEWEH